MIKLLPLIFGVIIVISAIIGISPIEVEAFQNEEKYSSVEPLNIFTFQDSRNKFYKTEINKKISLDFKNVNLKQALREIARKTGFRLTYRGDVLNDKIINLKSKSITVSRALDYILRSTGLEYYVSSDGYLLVTSSINKIKEDFIEIEITGRVTDQNTGEPLPSVNIGVLGTNIGTTTDIDGFYELTVPDDAETLVFSFVGYERLEVKIEGREVINVQMTPIVSEFDEVVVVGYGTQQRQEVTGSISSIDVARIRDIPGTSFENAIQGQIAGVNVQETSGQPGSTPDIRIRGTGSISAGNDPLFVIDGLPITRDTDLQGTLFRRRESFSPPTLNPLASLNPGDIASIEVLKDASAASIYGSRGANGVVMITTNRGTRTGDPIIRLNTSIGLEKDFNRIDMMDAEESIQFTKDARNNNYIDRFDPLNPASEFFNPDFNPDTNAGRPDDANVLIPERFVNFDGTNTDWLDLVFENAATSSVNASVSGGSENIGYYVSGGFINQKGVIIGDGDGFKRFTFRGNIQADLTDKLIADANLNLNFTKQDRLPADATYFARPPGIIYSAFVHSPVVNPFNTVVHNGVADGLPNQTNNQSHLGGAMTTASNPLAIIQAIDEQIQNNRQFGNISLRYQLLENLEVGSMFGFDLDSFQRSFFRGNSLLFRNATEGESFGQSSSALGRNWIYEATANYLMNPIDGHELKVFAGGTLQRQNSETNSIIAFNFPDDNVQTINAGQVTDGDSRIEEWSLASVITRLNYSINDKYLFTGTIRADKSSRFGPNNKTGVFPSFSVGWRATQEPFFDDNAFSELKLRFSYGETGNFLIPNFASFSLLDRENVVFGNQIVGSLAQVSLGDENLGWETTKEFNLGLDYGIFNDRLFGSLDVYRKKTSDLLLNISIPAALGFTTALTNIGEVRNKGFEASLTSRNMIKTNFQWASDFNISLNRNEVLSLAPGVDAILSQGAAGVRHITRVGDGIGSFFGHVVEGVYQSQEEIDNAPEDLLAPNPKPGDFRFKDINNDGVIDEDDRTVIGDYEPAFTWGFTNRFNYKNFDMSILFQGVVGRDIMNLTSRHIKNGEGNFNSLAVFNDRWRSPEEPGNGKIPRADRQTALNGNNNRPSTFQIEDGSYIRLRNVTLGYNFPTAILGDKIRNLRVSASATNLFIITDYLGFNPEVSTEAGGSLTPGQDIGQFPLTQSFRLNIDVTF